MKHVLAFGTFFSKIAFILIWFAFSETIQAQNARLLRQPTISEKNIAFTYGGDVWVADINGGEARRLTSTPAVESDPHFSPDGKWIAFTSDRSGTPSIYIVSVEGGMPKRLTWHPSGASARGWTPDGKTILYASSRETAPSSFNRLWTVSSAGGPSTLLPAPWGFDGSFAPDGKRMVIDRMSRWDTEWRAYRGGQNTSLTILDLNNLNESFIPCERTTDIQPVWLDNTIYFLSDREGGVSNVWAYNLLNGNLRKVTSFSGADVKWLTGRDKQLVIEREGYLHIVNPDNGNTKQLNITVNGDFPWAETKWEDVSKNATSASLSATGKRALMEARGDIFTIPVENGDARNLTHSSGAADRAPVWSPDGTKIAWFSDEGGQGYALLIGDQDGLSEPKRIAIGVSKMAWDPAWSPDGKYLVFVDNKVRVQVVDIAAGTIRTAGVGGINIERSSTNPVWSPDSKWLAFSRTAENYFRRIYVWSVDSGELQPLTDLLADAFAPAWDRDGRHLYFLASTDVALGSGWANTSSMQSEPKYGAYVVVLRKDDPAPFPLKSDEEPDTSKTEKKDLPKNNLAKGDSTKTAEDKLVRIDLDRIDRRTIALPIPVKNYRMLVSGPKGSVFIGEAVPNVPGMSLLKFTLEGRKAEDFTAGVSQVAVSADGKKIMFQSAGKWRVVDTSKPPAKSGGELKVALRMQLDRLAEWKQIFEEAWRYERDYFYDPSMHGRDWNQVYERYAPLVPFLRHRADLTYILDQVNGELSVGHSFVFGGDYPEVDKPQGGLLGTDLAIENGGWRIKRIYTAESWNPGLIAPLDQPNLKVAEGNYLVGINGVDLNISDDPHRLLDGTAGIQTVLHINDKPGKNGAWTIIVEPISNENALRQRAWVEDNRRKVDELSNGKLAYIWVPNTGGPGFVSFNRYFFAQQDRNGAVIDERFNGGGLLDDYMVDLMTRKLRAALTNEVPDGKPFKLPAGILGPKVLLINERAGSGGDFFPWVFRNQKVGPLIGKRTWGGLVKSSVHYALVDGGALTAPDNAVFDPVNNRWIAENEGVPPDIEVQLDAKSVSEGRDPQLERAVQEALKLMDAEKTPNIVPPAFSKPAKNR